MARLVVLDVVEDYATDKGYSQERLIGFLTKLGVDVEIVVRPRSKKRQGEGVVSVVIA